MKERYKYQLKQRQPYKMFLKKREGFSIEVLIIVVLVLGVVIILISLFSNRKCSNDFSKDINSCTIKGGFCASKCSNDRGYYAASAKCPEEGDSRSFVECCIAIKEKSRGNI